MATTSKKIAAKTATSATEKKPAVKKVVAKTPAAKVKTAATPVKKVTAPKAAKLPPAEAKPAKAPATRKSPAPKSVKKTAVSPEQRYHMIATAAYFRAEQRGFGGGYEMQDWISAEADIDAMLNA